MKTVSCIEAALFMFSEKIIEKNYFLKNIQVQLKNTKQHLLFSVIFIAHCLKSGSSFETLSDNLAKKSLWVELWWDKTGSCILVH